MTSYESDKQTMASAMSSRPLGLLEGRPPGNQAAIVTSLCHGSHSTGSKVALVLEEPAWDPVMSGQD